MTGAHKLVFIGFYHVILMYKAKENQHMAARGKTVPENCLEVFFLQIVQFFVYCPILQ